MDESRVTGRHAALAGLLVAVPLLVLALQSPSPTMAAYSATAPVTSSVMVAPARPTHLFSTRQPNAVFDSTAEVRQLAAQVEVAQKSNTLQTQLTKAGGALVMAMGFLALVAAAARQLLARPRQALHEFSEAKVDFTGISMASAAGHKVHTYALVVTNKGGGHGEIGFHLALALRAKGLQVQVINDNGGKDVSSKLPFSEYGQLAAAGVEVIFADLSQPNALQAATCPPEHLCRAYDYIFDNENVCQKEVADLAASCGAFYTYVSSGGMYVPGDKFPMKESNPTKKIESNEQKKHELYVMSDAVRPKLQGCAFFRPQYIVGPYTNKRDYLDWFFDRLTRNLPIPLPAPGTQTTTITDVRDVANMIASVVGKQEPIEEAEKANAEVGPVFNCASDRPVSLRQIVMMCGAACGKTEAETAALIRLYDPAAAKGAPSGGKFPFRDTNFDIGVDKAKVVLGWESEYNDFEDIVAAYYEGYKALGLHLKNPKMDTSWDEYILTHV